MLKLLLVGFTEQNANVIQMFIELTFNNVRVSRVSRLPETSAQKMPELTVMEKESDIFLMDAESIGIDPNQSIAAHTTFSEKLPNKAILLITRQTLPEATAAAEMPNFQWLSVPYTRKQMADKMQQLISIASLKQTQTATKEVDDTSPSVIAEPSNNPQLSQIAKKANDISQKSDSDSLAQQGTHQNPSAFGEQSQDELPLAESKHTDAMFQLLAKTFNGLSDTPFFEFAQGIYGVKDYTVLDINGHLIYIDPLEKTAIVDRVERVIDHFMIGKNIRNSFVNRQVLSEHEYITRTARHLENDSKKLTLGQLIWYVGLEMIPRNAFNQTHQLPIEVRYMPNLSGIKFVPTTVLPLIASALGRVRTLTDFNQLFPNLTNAQVNKIIILLVMSHSVNSAVLLSHTDIAATVSRTEAASTPSVAVKDKISQANTQANNVKNTGIEKAQRTGFLKRLLGKLGTKLS